MTIRGSMMSVLAAMVLVLPAAAPVQGGSVTMTFSGLKQGEQVMNYYTEDQVPVLTELVQNFVTFNHWHSGVPGVSPPYT